MLIIDKIEEDLFKNRNIDSLVLLKMLTVHFCYNQSSRTICPWFSPSHHELVLPHLFALTLYLYMLVSANSGIFQMNYILLYYFKCFILEIVCDYATAFKKNKVFIFISVS